MCIGSWFDVTAQTWPFDDINVRLNTGIIVLGYVIPQCNKGGRKARDRKIRQGLPLFSKAKHKMNEF